MTNEIADKTVENEIDWEARALKAEAKIVADKKAITPTKEETKIVDDVKDEKEEDNGSEMESLRAENEALKASAKIEANNITTNAMRIEWNSNNAKVGFEVISVKEYDHMTEVKQNEYLNASLKEHWELELTM